MQSILIIEDDKRVADLLKAGLEESGYHTMVAYDGAMGLRLLHPTASTLCFQTLFFQSWTVLNFARRYARPMHLYPYSC